VTVAFAFAGCRHAFADFCLEYLADCGLAQVAAAGFTRAKASGSTRNVCAGRAACRRGCDGLGIADRAQRRAQR
jgi:hypothetical protein